MNGFSPEILYLLDPNQGLCIPEGNTVCSVIGKLQLESRGRRPVRVRHCVNQATSECYLIRFADDFICCFEHGRDAERYQRVLPKRLGRYSLAVAEEKTKLIRFGRFAREYHQSRSEGSPEVFDFLGFTHYCGLSRKGNFKLKRKTSGKKLRVKLRELRLWFHHQLSEPIGKMWEVLNQKLRGHYQYYGINDNWPMLMAYREHVRLLAKRHLSRRSQKSYVGWSEFNRFCDLHPLASPKRLKDLIALNRSLLREGVK